MGKLVLRVVAGALSAAVLEGEEDLTPLDDPAPATAAAAGAKNVSE